MSARLRIFGALVAGLALLAMTPAEASDRNGKPRRAEVRQRDVFYRSFPERDVRIIRDYYAPRYRPLPRGLQKKLARTGQLPPGWYKKVQPFPYGLERRLVVLPAGYRRGLYDDRAVIFNPRTHVVIDLVPIF